MGNVLCMYITVCIIYAYIEIMVVHIVMYVCMYIYVCKSTEYIQLKATFLICAYAYAANRLIKVQRSHYLLINYACPNLISAL